MGRPKGDPVDGVLLLEERAGNLLSARLVAVKPGVVIDGVRSPWPAREPEPSARLPATALSPPGHPEPRGAGVREERC